MYSLYPYLSTLLNPPKDSPINYSLSSFFHETFLSHRQSPLRSRAKLKDVSLENFELTEGVVLRWVTDLGCGRDVFLVLAGPPLQGL